jgi:hypothetical protein
MIAEESSEVVLESFHRGNYDITRVPGIDICAVVHPDVRIIYYLPRRIG